MSLFFKGFVIGELIQNRYNLNAINNNLVALRSDFQRKEALKKIATDAKNKIFNLKKTLDSLKPMIFEKPGEVYLECRKIRILANWEGLDAFTFEAFLDKEYAHQVFLLAKNLEEQSGIKLEFLERIKLDKQARISIVNFHLAQYQFLKPIIENYPKTPIMKKYGIFASSLLLFLGAVGCLVFKEIVITNTTQHGAVKTILQVFDFGFYFFLILLTFGIFFTSKYSFKRKVHLKPFQKQAREMALNLFKNPKEYWVSYLNSLRTYICGFGLDPDINISEAAVETQEILNWEKRDPPRLPNYKGNE